MRISKTSTRTAQLARVNITNSSVTSNVLLALDDFRLAQGSTGIYDILPSFCRVRLFLRDVCFLQWRMFCHLCYSSWTYMLVNDNYIYFHYLVFTSLIGDAIFFFAAHRVDHRFVQGLVGTYEVSLLAFSLCFKMFKKRLVIRSLLMIKNS